MSYFFQNTANNFRRLDAFNRKSSPNSSMQVYANEFDTVVIELKQSMTIEIKNKENENPSDQITFKYFT